MPKIIENKLIEEFKDKESFSRKHLLEFFKNFEPDLKEGTLRWRIHDLKNKNIIKSVKRGIYTLSFKPKYKPVLSSEIIKITRKINESFEDVKYCIWETSWINEFSQHQASKQFLIIEIEKDLVESLYFYLKDSFRYDFFLNLDENAMEYYIAESRFPVIIKKMITRSPLSKLSEKKVNLNVPSLEKVLVDLFAEEKLFFFYQGAELVHIYKNAINAYSINFTRLLSYARRREKETAIKTFLMSNMSNSIKDIIND